MSSPPAEVPLKGKTILQVLPPLAASINDRKRTPPISCYIRTLNEEPRIGAAASSTMASVSGPHCASGSP